MDQNSDSEIERLTPANKKSGKIRLVYATVAVLLIGILGAGGWLYYDSTRKIHDQKALISDLRERLRDAGIEVPRDADDEDEAPASPATCDGGSEYSAEIGKFDLTLSDPHVNIRTLDANFEGGPITELSVGRCVEGEMNVVDVYPTNEVNILGHPASDSATLRTNFEARWGSPLTAGGTVIVDGVTAQIYTGEGLFSTKLLYFDHGGIGYQIELADANATSEATLTDVISDWSSTP